MDEFIRELEGQEPELRRLVAAGQVKEAADLIMGRFRREFPNHDDNDLRLLASAWMLFKDAPKLSTLAKSRGE